jgi:hypothetical protein
MYWRKSIGVALGGALAMLSWLPAPVGAQPAVAYKIVTASERGTYIQIGRDLAKFIAPQAQIELDALPSAGSAENIHRLRYEPGVKFALVQSDVYQAFINQSNAGDNNAAAIIKPLRVILPLYNEELYFIVRADSPLNFVHEIRDSTINVGPLRSGTAMSATTLYRLMFERPPLTIACRSSAMKTHWSSSPATSRSTSSSWSRAARQTVGRHEARSARADQAAQVRRRASIQQGGVEDVLSSTVRAASYPNVLTEDVPGIAGKPIW